MATTQCIERSPLSYGDIKAELLQFNENYAI